VATAQSSVQKHSSTAPDGTPQTTTATGASWTKRMGKER
jgi:hypothetical protein